MIKMADENWKPVPGYEGIYDVSDLGRVRSLDRYVSYGRWGAGNKRFEAGKVFSPSLDRYGYPKMLLRKDAESINTRVHKVVMLAFVGPAPEGKQVNHINGNREEAKA